MPSENNRCNQRTQSPIETFQPPPPKKYQSHPKYQGHDQLINAQKKTVTFFPFVSRVRKSPMAYIKLYT